MKRLIAWLLLGCMLLLAACGEERQEPAAESSQAGNAESSAPGDSSATEEPTDPRFTVVSVGKPYTVSVEPSETYPDLHGQQLTDGRKAFDTGVHYTDPRMVGYTDDISVIIDLGEDGKRLSGVAARGLDMNKDGVKLPLAVRAYGSDDGKTWKGLGKHNFTATGDQTVSTAKVEFDQLVDYRYIRIRVTRTGGFLFVDELEVYADVDPKEAPFDNAATLYRQETIDRGAWATLSTGTTAKPTDSANLALYKSYTFENCTFDPRAPEDTTLLTDDGRTGRMFEQAVWVGIQGTGSIVVDLGKTQKNVYAVKVYALGDGYEVSLPDAVDFYGSYDGKSYTLLGRAYAPAAGEAHHVYTLLLPEYIKTRYVKVTIPEGDGNHWIEEIQVLGGLSEAQETELYPPLNLPYVTEDEYWDSSESDYKKEQNLLLGLIQQVACSGYEPSHELQPDAQKRTDWNSPVLTDGLLADSEYMYCYNGEWFFMTGGNAYDFFYDLGKLCTLNSFEISLLEQTAWGISRPKAMSIFLSDDGETWYEVYEYLRDNNIDMNENATRLVFECELSRSYAARFVRFRIEGAATFVDEFRAFGTKRVKDSVKRLDESGILPVIYYTSPAREQYANSENTTVKANDIICTYGNVDYGEGLKAYVAYVDGDGKAQDFLFDGFLYGMHGLPQSDNRVHLTNNKADWEENFAQIFDGVGGLDLLNQTVGQVKEELNRPDYQAYVYITMWCVCERDTDFGDVDGDGKSEDMSKAADREKVVNWFTQMCMDEFAKRGYQHIVLDGFYWQGESVNWDDPATEYNEDNSHIIAEVSEYIHAKGTNFLWIPYYTANRYYQAYELGFDLICMQPNYMFDLTQPLYRFDVTAARTKRQHMCVEIEHSYQALSDPLFAQNYMKYLYYGALTGYMNEATHIYYADLTNYIKLAYSDNPIARMQYDATYAFITGTLEITPEALEVLKLEGSQDTVLEGNLNANGDVMAQFTLSTAPAHGYVTVTADGAFRYFPEKGYTGTDFFTYTYNRYLGESETCTVEIAVK